MDISAYIKNEKERPLDVIKPDGGFFGIFRTVACVGDSLASGEFQTVNPHGGYDYYDRYDYSWGQFMARATGCKVYNFSRGGMTASEYVEAFAACQGYWNPKLACQAYIIALGVNDIVNQRQEMGAAGDIYTEKKTFAAYYEEIIRRYEKISPGAYFFLTVMPRDGWNGFCLEQFGKLIYDIAKGHERCHVIDFAQYAPVYDKEFEKNFYLNGHMKPQGYLMTAHMYMSYIDYIIRQNPDEFDMVGLMPQAIL